jgi:hypothetical protein
MKVMGFAERKVACSARDFEGIHLLSSLLTIRRRVKQERRKKDHPNRSDKNPKKSCQNGRGKRKWKGRMIRPQRSGKDKREIFSRKKRL